MNTNFLKGMPHGSECLTGQRTQSFHPPGHQKGRERLSHHWFHISPALGGWWRGEGDVSGWISDWILAFYSYLRGSTCSFRCIIFHSFKYGENNQT